MRGRIGHRRERGSALVLALIAVSMVAALGAAYLQLTSSVTRRQGAEVENTQAFYLAEAGLAESFQAVRIGRTGQIGSIGSPVRYGQGLLWVDAVDTADDQIRLTSTAMSGTGRAALSYVLEAEPQQLGFYSVEGMLVDQVVMVDGYDSEKGTYESQIPENDNIEGYIPKALEQYLGQGCSCGVTVGCHLGYHNWCSGKYDHEKLFGSGRYYYNENGVWTFLADPEVAFVQRNYGAEYFIAAVREQVNDYYDKIIPQALASGSEEIPLRPANGLHTGQSGLLGSADNIAFELANGDYAEVYGDVTPGIDREVDTGSSAIVSGSTEPRTIEPDLPEVLVPPIALSEAVTYEDVLPWTIASGESGFAGLTVGADSEVVIRGPATVVIGDLVLAPGANLVLDTRDGDVNLYVTGRMDLQPGSSTSTLGDQPSAMTLQVASSAASPAGPTINLDATGRFFGTIYAPDTDVHIGSGFEIFGGAIARKLTFGPGARIHVDRSGNRGDSLPKIVAWQVVELPNQIKGLATNPYDILGVNKGDLSSLVDGNDLGNVTIYVTYTTTGGGTSSYTGPESGFDWDQVAGVSSIERIADRTKEDDAVAAAAADDAVEEIINGIRTDVQDIWNAFGSGQLNASEAYQKLATGGYMPLSAEERDMILNDPATTAAVAVLLGL